MSEKQNRRLAAILFADIAGYTALMQKNENRARTLVRKFQDTMARQVKANRGQLVQFYGDGCLCTFDSAVAAMRCASSTQRIFQSEPKVPVRIGLHSGDVVFEAENVFGDSVNIASRIESLGVPGAILFSKRIKRHISNQPEFEVQSLGEFDFKNVEKTMEVFALANEGFVIPKREQMKGKVKSQKRKWLIPAMIAAVLLLAVIVFQSGFFTKKEYQEGEISLAVVPFRNISGDDGNSHYGMGMASEIRTKLSLSKKFEYLSSLQATAAYANSDKAPKEIGRELNVDYLLMGMFQIEGDDIRVNIELLDAETGMSVEEIPQYENKFADIFKLQSDISNQVLRQFSFFNQSKPVEKEYEPDVLAYGHYLKGNEILAGGYSFNTFENAIAQYEAAIQLDSNYLSAWMGLVRAKTEILFSFKNNDSLRQEVSEIMGHIETHFPESWEKNLAKGLYEYHILLRYEKGLQHFLKVLEENPENFLANLMVSAIYKRYLQTEKAFHHLAKSKNQNPLSAVNWSEIGIVQRSQGNDTGAMNAYKTSISLRGSKYFKNQLFAIAIVIGDMTIIPEALKTEYKNDLSFYDNYFKQNWRKCLSILDTATSWGIRSNDIDFQEDGIFHRKMEIYFITENMDSSIHYALQLLAYYDRHPNNINIDRKAYALSILDKHAESIALIQSGTFNNGLWAPIPEEDILRKAERMLLEVRNYTLLSDYEKATATLLEINERYPNFGNYFSLRSDPLYNRIKKEHPPFAKALAELKLPELLPFEEALKD